MKILKLLILMGVAVWILIQLAVPKFLQNQIETSAHHMCHSCSLTIQKLKFDLFTNHLQLLGVKWLGGTPDTTALTASISEINVRVLGFNFFDKTINLGAIQIKNANFKITEGDQPAPNVTSDDAPPLWKIRIQSVEIESSEFAYVRIYEKPIVRRAELKITNIFSQGSALAFALPYCEQLVTINTQGVLQNSGRFTLKLDMPLCSKEMKLDLSLQLFNQNLASLSKFFHSSAGINLKGIIQSGVVDVKIAGQSSSTYESIRYNELAVRLEKSPDRGLFEVLLSNLIQSARLITSNGVRDPMRPTQQARLIRHKSEPIIKFILRGMQVTAMKVIYGN